MRLVFAIALLSVLVGCGSLQPPAASPKSTAASPFVAERVEGLGNPEVTIENASDVPFTIVLIGASSTTIDVPPHEKRTVRLTPGTWAFEASAPNLFPVKGEQAFAEDVRYSWKFTVVTKSADDPEFVGKGWHCFEVKGAPAYLVCTRHKDKCEKTRAEPGPPGEPPLSECAEYKVVYSFIDEAKNVAISATTLEGCEKLRPTYLKQATDPTKVTPCKEHP